MRSTRRDGKGLGTMHGLELSSRATGFGIIPSIDPKQNVARYTLW
ncbi:hypothetical protein ACPOL_4212 [Acidisarcina polymorpha]|uniref:Uncharacterized protein n=1 Tax=Acidisarcina polymorpha TaxID=2211140 RepID=A0A2Z5G354_9BACT|nr:hypothetical protein ACPOL_4212 [Acidisarcina polymorpha]